MAKLSPAERAGWFLWTVVVWTAGVSLGSMAALWGVVFLAVLFEEQNTHMKVMFPQIAAGCGMIFGALVGAVIGIVRFVLFVNANADEDDQQKSDTK